MNNEKNERHSYLNLNILSQEGNGKLVTEERGGGRSSIKSPLFFSRLYLLINILFPKNAEYKFLYSRSLLLQLFQK